MYTLTRRPILSIIPECRTLRPQLDAGLSLLERRAHPDVRSGLAFESQEQRPNGVRRDGSLPVSYHDLMWQRCFANDSARSSLNDCLILG